MAATSDDDVPTGETATGHDESPDGDTTAAATAPATTVPSVVDDDDEEDRTVQQPVDPKLRNAARNAVSSQGASSQRAPAPARPPPPAPAPPMRMTSKKPTAVGLGSPLPITRPAAGLAGLPAAPPKAQAPSPAVSPPADDEDSAETIQTEADADDGSITATAPAPRLGVKGASLPLTLPGSVQIRELPSVDDDDALDETEVRTVVSGLTNEEPAAPVPAAGRPSEPPPNEADEPDDSVTTQAPSAVKNARLPEQDDEPKTSPPARLSPPPKPIPAAGRRPGDDAPPFTVPSVASDEDAYDADESVTTRGPAVPEYEDDSVTAQAPVARAAAPHTPIALGVPPALDTLDDGTDGTTKRVAKRAQVPAPGARGEADDADLEDAESITTQAPGHLTNMLRVIATPEDAIEGDDSAENKTAVMLGAPVKPVGASSAGALRAARPILTGSSGLPSGAHAAALADLREPSSDSGLRVARAEVPSGDHASLSALMSGPVALQPDHVGGTPSAHSDLRSIRDASPAAFANTEQAFNASPHPQGGPQSSLRELDFGASGKKPRYGLLVGLVAVLSFTIPLVLFLWLQQGMAADDALPRTPSEVAPDLVGRGDSARPRATKGGAPTPSTPPSQAPANGGGNRGPWFPRRR